MNRIGLTDLAALIDRGELQAAEFCFCCQKIRYATKADARRAGAEMKAKGKGHTRPYECRRRGGWHLTSKLQRPA